MDSLMNILGKAGGKMLKSILAQFHCCIGSTTAVNTQLTVMEPSLFTASASWGERW
jgi:hypothetical protein